MYKTSITLDIAVKTIVENELGILLLQKENESQDLFSILATKVSYEKRIGMFGNNMSITYHLFPLLYHIQEMNDGMDRADGNIRFEALYNVFDRWTAKGYNKHHAKSPFGCKAFMKYIDEIGWTEADFILLLVSDKVDVATKKV